MEGGDRLKIRWLVNGHSQQTVSLEKGRKILAQELAKGNLIVDEELRQLQKLEGLSEDSVVTVYPAVVGG